MPRQHILVIIGFEHRTPARLRFSSLSNPQSSLSPVSAKARTISQGTPVESPLRGGAGKKEQKGMLTKFGPEGARAACEPKSSSQRIPKSIF